MPTSWILCVICVILALISQKVLGDLGERSKCDKKNMGFSLQAVTKLRTLLLGGVKFWKSQIWENIIVIYKVTSCMKGINKEQSFIASFITWTRGCPINLTEERLSTRRREAAIYARVSWCWKSLASHFMEAGNMHGSKGWLGKFTEEKSIQLLNTQKHICLRKFELNVVEVGRVLG